MTDVVFDIDGTLANITHRLHYIKTKPKNWKAFQNKVSEDAPILPTIHLLGLLDNAGCRIVLASGRNEEARADTEAWLEQHGVIYERLYMRSLNDYRDDSIIKKEILDEMRQDGYDPYMVFDDRKRVVDMWRENGIQTYQVAEGDF